jgi:DNA-binding NarL/FixJ family response regulator
VQIAALVATGMSNAEIAAALNYSVSTIRRGLATLSAQLEENDRERLITKLNALGFAAWQRP